jgi:hypothetical protein
MHLGAPPVHGDRVEVLLYEKDFYVSRMKGAVRVIRQSFDTPLGFHRQLDPRKNALHV